MCFGFVAVKVVKLGMGIAVPSVVLPPASRSWASAALGSGGHDRGIMATSSIPQGLRSSNHSHGCLVVSGTNCFSHGRRQANQKHCQRKIVVQADTMRKMRLELPHEDAGLEALHLHGESKKLKIGLPYALSELPKHKTYFKRSKD